MLARGSFEVSLSPSVAPISLTSPALYGDMTINKSFTGDLVATSTGQMLSVRLVDAGSAGYVAIEQVTGHLLGKTGSFVLQHYGVMTREMSHLTLEVIPQSGSEELEGLSGSMSIEIIEGKHFYAFEFELPK